MNKFTLTLASFFLAIIFSTVLPAGQAGKSGPDMDALKMIIEAKNLAFTQAHVTGDREVIDAMFTDDARVLPPNSDPVEGRQAIDELTRQYIEYGVYEFHEETIDFYGSGDLLIDQGNYVMVYGPEKTREEGKYLNVWRLVDGDWKIHSNIWNSNATE